MLRLIAERLPQFPIEEALRRYLPNDLAGLLQEQTADVAMQPPW
jgi:hypothetical protein